MTNNRVKFKTLPYYFFRIAQYLPVFRLIFMYFAIYFFTILDVFAEKFFICLFGTNFA